MPAFVREKFAFLITCALSWFHHVEMWFKPLLIILSICSAPCTLCATLPILILLDVPDGDSQNCIDSGLGKHCQSSQHHVCGVRAHLDITFVVYVWESVTCCAEKRCCSVAPNFESVYCFLSAFVNSQSCRKAQPQNAQNSVSLSRWFRLDGGHQQAAGCVLQWEANPVSYTHLTLSTTLVV